ncbi:PucR family transcriptional regulator [Gordonia tangerina]|uniref:Helix-turn-helix domain-containing protein n=1 Tax=Gordonia tangerina TaxID=2911060 RepID=A0ABS9DHH2_9ACTN|nr:helix-turn-helix domain-containing protein [Gordonia tangerina]MCF3938678.1 helix-turn-helix domain-containing protein [Gordonia tangerina]
MSSGSLQRRLVSPNAPEAAEVHRLVAVVGDRLQARFAEINASMNAAIEAGMDELTEPDLLDMLHASVEGNITTILQMIRNDIPLDHVQPITAATEYADRLGQRGIPASSLRRAYHFGSDDLLAFMFEEVRGLDCPPEMQLHVLHHLSGWMHKYVDWITGVVLEIHEEGRRFSVEQNATVVSAMVGKVLRGEDLTAGEFALRTGYSLQPPHLAATLWIDRANPGSDDTGLLETTAREMAGRLGCVRPPLFTVVDRSTAWVWFGSPADVDPTNDAVLRSVTAAVPGLRVAFGAPASGTDGFRSSHDQAEAIKHVAIVSTNPAMSVVGHNVEGMAVVAVLARDLDATRRWVHDVLGPLSLDTDAAARLRETVRTFLSSGNSYVTTAEKLNMHRNTVKYRLGRAIDELGRPLSERRLDTELALHVAEILGSVVLTGSS